jgi:hypothetical protein
LLRRNLPYEKIVMPPFNIGNRSEQARWGFALADAFAERGRGGVTLVGAVRFHVDSPASFHPAVSMWKAPGEMYARKLGASMNPLILLS